jgi:chemotaxis protein CheZ
MANRSSAKQMPPLPPEIPNIESITAVVENVIRTMHGDLTSSHFKIQADLRALADYIQSAREELRAAGPFEIRERDIPTATDELDAVVAAAEEATNTILAAAEEIEAVAGQIDAGLRDRLGGAVTRIYEACNFQDITGQRVAKVVRTLRHIESKIDMMVAALDPENAGVKIDKTSVAAPVNEKGDSGLLNGPQLPGAATSQEEIDAILASFD